jgi:hypothetical protein
MQTEYAFENLPLWGGGSLPFFTLPAMFFRFSMYNTLFLCLCYSSQTIDAFLKIPWEKKHCNGLVQ